MFRSSLTICIQIASGALHGLHPSHQIEVGLAPGDEGEPRWTQPLREISFDDATWEDAEWQ